MLRVINIRLRYAVFTAVTVIISLAPLFFSDSLLQWSGKTGEWFSVLVLGFLSTVSMVPVPVGGVSLPFVAEIAERNSLLIIAGIYAFGSALGESATYLVGSGVISRIDMGMFARRVAELLSKRHTWSVLFLVSCVPILPFDAIGGIVGVAKYPYYKFIIAVSLGRWIRVSVLLLLLQAATTVPWYAYAAFGTALSIAGLVVVWKYRKKVMVLLKGIDPRGFRIGTVSW